MEGEFDRALEYFQKQSANASTIGDKQGISGVMANTGWVQSSIGNYREALGDFQELLRNSEELNDVAGISFAEYSIANIRKEFGEYADAEKHYLRAIDIGRRIQLKYYLCSYLYDMADLQLQMKKPELSQTLAREALAIAQEVGKKEAIVSSEILLAKIVALTDLAKAIDQLKGLLTSAADEDSGKAHIHYELCRLTGEESERKEALALYRRLYEKIPLRKYQDRIEELESNAD
jgi:tetratricopeptide (TPR) repeat protein